MKHSALEFISKYKHNSIFIKIFVMVNVLALVLMGIFYVFSVQMVTRNLKEKTYLSNLNMLNKTKNAVEMTFSYLDQVITSLSEDGNIISAVVVPGVLRYDRNFKIINHLSFTAEKNNLINRIILFVPFDKSFFTSEKQIGIMENPSDYPLISRLCDPGSLFFTAAKSRLSDIINDNGRIYLKKEFPLTGNARMGIILFELSAEGLYRIIQGDYTIPSSNILVFDAENKPLFMSRTSDDVLAGEKHIQNVLQKDMEISEAGQQVWFLSKSDGLEWKFLYFIDADLTKSTHSGTLAMLLPLLAFLFIFSVLLSLYISRNIYFPIESLIRSITSDSGIVDSSSHVRNEIEYIDTVFNQTLAQKEVFANTIQEIAPEVLEKLFLNLLTGKTVDSAHIEATLRDLNCAFGMKGKYTVFVLSLMNADFHSVSEIEESLYTISLENLIREYVDERFAFHVQAMVDAYVAVVFYYDPNSALVPIKQFEAELVHHIADSVRNTTFRVFIEKGGMYDSLEDIRYSFEEAKRLLSYHKYAGGQEEFRSGFTGEQEKEFTHDYFHVRMDNLVCLIEEGKGTEAEKLSENMVKEIIEYSKEIHEIRAIYMVYMDVLMETLFSLNVNCSEEVLCGKIDIDTELSEINRLEDMAAYIKKLSHNAITVMQEHHQKRQHKFIIAAKSYIEEKYFDNMLSLNSVADYINANPSYLSKLFKDNLGINFIEYLNAYRLNKAKIMLWATRLTIKEIGFRTGFNSQQNFIRVFKKYEGLTPGRYREIKPEAKTVHE